MKVLAVAAFVGLVAVRCGRGTDSPTEPSTEAQAQLSVAAVDVACTLCETETNMYVRDQLFSIRHAGR